MAIVKIIPTAHCQNISRKTTAVQHAVVVMLGPTKADKLTWEVDQIWGGRSGWGRAEGGVWNVVAVEVDDGWISSRKGSGSVQWHI